MADDKKQAEQRKVEELRRKVETEKKAHEQRYGKK